MKNLLSKAALASVLGLAYSQMALAARDDLTCTGFGSAPAVSIAQVQGASVVTPLLTTVTATQTTALTTEQLAALDSAEYQTESEYRVTAVVSSVLSNAITLYNDDSDPATSDGLFVYFEDDSVMPAAGNTVCVRGVIREYFGETQLTATDSKWSMIDNTTTAPAAVVLTYNSPAPDSVEVKPLFSEVLERHEGMLVTLPDDMDDQTRGFQTMRVTKTFGFDFYLFNTFDERRNNIGLAYSRINTHPNMVGPPGSTESLNQRAQNEDYLLFLESDDRTTFDDDLPYYPDFGNGSNTDVNNNAIRINDGVINLSGVMRFEYNNYRLYVPDNASFDVDISNFVKNTPRESAPSLSTDTDYDEFIVKVGTLNILNFFNSPFGGDMNPLEQNRGAERSDNFERQTEKLVATLFAMDSDIVGLLELENNGFGRFSAIKALQDALNAEYDEEDPINRNDADYIGNRYAFVGVDSNNDMLINEMDNIGGDAVTTGIIYRPSAVTLESAKVIPMPYQLAPIIVDTAGAAVLDKDGLLRESGENFQRDSLVATFIVHATGKRLTVVSNHLKSKGSSCWEDWKGWEDLVDFDPVTGILDDLDFQGNCEGLRVAAAVQLGNYLDRVGGDRVILGDLNAYTFEDALLVLTSNPTNKTINAARDTYIGDAKQFGSNGATITKTYGYISAAFEKDKEKDLLSWSFSFNDEVGSLDHMLISPSMQTRLVDAVEWHINAAESNLFDYESSDGAGSVYRSSDHDPAIMALSYRYGETTQRNREKRVFLSNGDGQMQVPFIVDESDAALIDDVAKIKITRGLDQEIATIALPSVTLTVAGEQTILFDVAGLQSGDYTFEMYLVKGEPVDPNNSTFAKGDIVASSKTVMDATVGQRAGLAPQAIIPPYDNTGGGGSLSIALLLSLLMATKRNKRTTH